MDPLTYSQLTGISVVEIGIFEIVMRLGLAFLLGALIALTYRKVHKAFAYSYSMVVGIIMVSMIVTMVLMVIDNSLARAFGLMGALAIIRFRMPIKDIKDIMFLFLAIGNGIACGAGHFQIAVISVLSIVVVCALMYLTKFGGSKGSGQLLLKILTTKEFLEEKTDTLIPLLDRFCVSFSLVETHMGRERDCEIIYSVRITEEGRVNELLGELSGIQAVEQVVVLSSVHNLDVQ